MFSDPRAHICNIKRGKVEQGVFLLGLLANLVASEQSESMDGSLSVQCQHQVVNELSPEFRSRENITFVEEMLKTNEGKLLCLQTYRIR